MMLFLFISFGLLFLLSINITLSYNITYSILSLIISAFIISIILLILGFEFLPYLIIMVYIGAVVILFLFALIAIKLDYTAYQKRSTPHFLNNHLIICFLLLFKAMSYFYFTIYTSFNCEIFLYSNV